MRQSKFIRILEYKRIGYKIKDGVISIIGGINGFVDLCLIDSLPENVHFNNGGDVNLDSITLVPKSTQFNNGRNIFLRSLNSLAENIQLNNGGGYVHLKSEILINRKSYIERYNLEVKDDKVILYKKVSKDFLTQEGKCWATLWQIGSTLTHPNWNPIKEECGAEKFHACAKPFWCDVFRSTKDDRYIAIEVKVEDLYEWTENPIFPQKISFREGKVLYECDRLGTKV